MTRTILGGTDEPLAVVIMDPDAQRGAELAAVLNRPGLRVLAWATGNAEGVDLCSRLKPQAVVIDQAMLRRAGAARGRELSAAALVVLAEPERHPGSIYGARAPVDALVLRPVDAEHLAAVTALAVTNRRRLAEAAMGCADLRHQLDERKIVERAKGVLIGRMGCTPEQAEEHLAALSRESGRSMGRVAADIINESGAVDRAG